MLKPFTFFSKPNTRPFSQFPSKSNNPSASQLDAVSAYFAHALTSKSISQDVFSRQFRADLYEKNPTWQLQFLNTLSKNLKENAHQFELHTSFSIDYQRMPEVLKDSAIECDIPTILFPTKAYIAITDNDCVMYDDLDSGEKDVRISADEFINKVAQNNNPLTNQIKNLIRALASNSPSADTQDEASPILSIK